MAKLIPHRDESGATIQRAQDDILHLARLMIIVGEEMLALLEEESQPGR